MKSHCLSLALFAFAAVCFTGDKPPEYQFRLSQVHGDECVEVAKNITIKKFRFEETPWREILAYIEKASKEGDSEGKGISIFVPDEFKAEFEPIANSLWTMQLADNLNILTIFVEAPPPEWFYFPVAPRRVAVIPQKALVNDLPSAPE